MSNTALTDWLSINSLASSLLRIAIVWLAFYGTGSLLLKIKNIKKIFKLMPPVIPGMLVYMGIIATLSLFNLLTRRVVPLFLISGMLAGLVILYIRLKQVIRRFILPVLNPVMILLWLLVPFILCTNLLTAARPEINFNDSQVTYLVQPDRWLNDGHMSFLEETTFSCFPLTSEILLVLPSSLAENRIDQLILGQLFQMSMLIMLVFICMRILDFKWKWFAPAFISICGCTILVIWSHFVKPDSTALFFVTTSLCMLMRQYEDKNYRFEMSSFPVMGLALSSKLTAYIALIPFLSILIYLIWRDRWTVSRLIAGFSLLGLLPVFFMIRTMIHTGSPFYPIMPVKSLLRSEWVRPEYDLTYDAFNDRSSVFFKHFNIIQNVWHYFRTWGATIFLLIAGLFTAFNRKVFRNFFAVFAGIAIYAIISLVLFYPAWWGAKYGMLLIPFSAIFGLLLLRRIRRGLLLASCIAAGIYILYESPLSPTDRYGPGYNFSLLKSYITENWCYEDFPMLERQPELAAIFWMNNILPENSSILSLFATKRYFSNHRWLVIWRHPSVSLLFLENSLEEEIEILEEQGIDFIFAQESDPVPFDGENELEILSRIGPDDILEPLVNIEGYTVYRFVPERL